MKLKIALTGLLLAHTIYLPAAQQQQKTLWGRIPGPVKWVAGAAVVIAGFFALKKLRPATAPVVPQSEKPGNTSQKEHPNDRGGSAVVMDLSYKNIYVDTIYFHAAKRKHVTIQNDGGWRCLILRHPNDVGYSNEVGPVEIKDCCNHKTDGLLKQSWQPSKNNTRVTTPTGHKLEFELNQLVSATLLPPFEQIHQNLS